MHSARPFRVRDLAVDDTDALHSLFAELGLFEPHELVELAKLVTTYFASGLGPDHHWLACDDGRLVGAAYYALDTSVERKAPGTWNLYFIGVIPQRQGSGCGSALVRHVENALARSGGVELLVETSGRASFEATRGFYRKHGYNEVARIADAYNPGDDKVIFRKALMVESPPPTGSES